MKIEVEITWPLELLPHTKKLPSRPTASVCAAPQAMSTTERTSSTADAKAMRMAAAEGC